MADPNQRALGAVLSGPAFRTRVGSTVMHAANRHIERWAPETEGRKQRSLRSLGFVDRLVTPWVETAQRSASLRMFQAVRAGETPVRETSPVSWVFPRPWFQDELDWMAAAKQTGQGERGMLTTRGTYVPSAAQRVPSALHEYVAPSLSLAQGMAQQPASVGYGSSNDFGSAYSPLVPFAAVQAAMLMQRTVAPAIATTPSMRGVLTTLLARTAAEPSRISQLAPEMVTPPAPRRPLDGSLVDDGERMQAEAAARSIAEQHAHLARLEQMARANAVRDLAASRARDAADAQQRADAIEAARREREQSAANADRNAEQRRIEERIAQRLSERHGERPAEQRLHETSRAQAAEHARTPLPEISPVVAAPIERRAPAEVVAAIAALPPELQAVVTSNIAQRPDQAFTAIALVSEQLRAAELMARTSAANESFEMTRGPRVLMPSGLGGLVATIDRTGAPMMPSALVGERRDAGLLRTPHLPSVFVAPRTEMHSALGATAGTSPTALTHVAWADRWLARFAGATPTSLEAYEGHQLALSAPESVFVAPMFERPPVQRFDDNAETPDEVFLQISAAAAKRRSAPAPAPAPAPAAPAPAPQPLRASLADLVARAAPSAPDAGLGAQLAASPFAPALRHMMPLPVQQSFDVRALFGGLSASYLAGTLAAPSRSLEIAAPQLDYLAPRAWAPSTMRNDLLAQTEVADNTSYGAPRSASRSAPVSGVAARSMVDAMALPMLFAADLGDGALASPGMVAERALGWSVAQERSSADLAHDFVSPELVLAARVYGLGAADAAMASRLALAGPSQLTAMAGAVDRTFVQAMAVEADRSRNTFAYPMASSDAEVTAGRSAGPHRSTSAFGVDRRPPRGAYLWPAATVAALGMTAPAPDSDHGMSIAALELLAARAVAELGTFAAISGPSGAPVRGDQTDAGDASAPGERPAASARMPATTAQSRARFDALYLAIGGTPEGRTVSPAARAARALALAGRGEDAPLSAYERAAAAWNVLPVVYAAEATGTAGPERSARRTNVDARPGLSMLSGRAGEALGSYVAPLVTGATEQYAAEVATAAAGEAASFRVPLSQRAGSAAPELVQTGSRSSARSGGGEAEIPAWFEKAARKMLAERTGQSDGISLAELTLINTTAPQQIAASHVEAPGGSSGGAKAPSAGTAEKSSGKVDIDQVANEVYEQLMLMMDAARARNGEPYL